MRGFTGEIHSAVVLSSVDGRSRDRFSISGDTPAVSGGVVTLFVRVSAVRTTSRHVHVLTSRLFFSRQTALFNTSAPTWPLYTVQRTTTIHFNLITRNTSVVSGFKTKQVAQLSQRDRAAGSISFGQKWKTGTGRRHFAEITGLSSTTVT